MSSFAEFCIVALLLFVAESIYWTPLRTVSLCVSERRKKCRLLDPSRWFKTSRVGIVFPSLFPGSPAFMPCHAFPLLVDDEDRWLLQADDGRFIRIEAPQWSDIDCKEGQLHIGKRRVKVSGVRCVEVLRDAKQRGLSPAQAVRLVWQRSLSQRQAQQEWRKWRMLAEPLWWAQPFLLGWFCFGLLLYVLQGESFRYLYFLSCLFIIMVTIAVRVWWMIHRAYPMCRRELMMDAILCFLVPFHGMRVAETLAVKVFAGVHPYAMLQRLQPDHPWLVKQWRQLSHPRPKHIEDEILWSAMTSYLTKAWPNNGVEWAKYDETPHEEREEGEDSFCPRCHSRFLAGISVCRDCDNYSLRSFGER